MYRDAHLDSNRDRGHDFLATLSFAAEQAALQDSLASTSNTPAAATSLYRSDASQYHVPSAHIPVSYAVPTHPNTVSAVNRQTEDISAADLGIDDSLDSLANFLDNGALSSYHFSSIISAEQPVPFFSPDSLSYSGDAVPDTGPYLLPQHRLQSPTRNEEQTTFSRFGSRLPSLQPEEAGQNKTQRPRKRALADISLRDRELIIEKLNPFSSAVSSDFTIPTRLALSRYLAAYISGFHEHLPFLHIPTMCVESCSIELILAMAAVGAQYCFEGERGVELFHASQAIASRRIRHRDARLAASRRDYRSGSTYSRDSFSYAGGTGMPSYAGTPDNSLPEEDLIQTAQALLLLMAMATWAKHKEILREALAIPSALATIIREDGLKCASFDAESWDEWVRMETVKRTKFIVFCFFNLHCIVYNIPPLILNCEYWRNKKSVHFLPPAKSVQLRSSWSSLQVQRNSKHSTSRPGERRGRSR